MDNKSIRQLIDHLDNLDRGQVLIRTPKHSFFSTRLNFEETWINEGEIGRKIGSTIGGIFGKDAGDRLGQIGSNIGDIFDKTSPNKPSQTSLGTTTNTITKYDMDGDPNYEKNRGDRADPLGNRPQDYTDVLAPLITCKMALKSGGKFINEILTYVNHDDTRSDTKTVKVNSWEFKRSTLAMVERTMGDEWWDMATMASDHSAEYVKLGLDIMNDQYKGLGWEYTGGTQKRVPTSLGTAMATYVNMDRKNVLSILSTKHTMARAAICVGIQIGDKKTLHSPDMFFVGPMSDWQDGGEATFMSMLSSLQLASGATLLKK